jgi:peptidoglycan-N-acetylglucosamine deacetylase
MRRRTRRSPGHTFSHPLLNRMPLAVAEAEIDRGFGAVDTALYRRFERVPKTPFFRFPGFASSAALLDRIERRGIAVFGADLWASDGDPMTPRLQLQLVRGRLAANRGGIVLFHDTKAQTAAMLPTFLRALKNRALSACARRSGVRIGSFAARRFHGTVAASPQAHLIVPNRGH